MNTNNNNIIIMTEAAAMAGQDHHSNWKKLEENFKMPSVFVLAAAAAAERPEI